MTTLYKLTDADGYTRRGETNECRWGPGITHAGTGQGELCGPGYIHAYQSPLLAILLNPIHACIDNPRLWECEGEIVKDDKGFKCGSISLTTIKEIDVPIISAEQKIKFAILCAIEVCKDTNWKNWAQDWLSGKDRTAYAAARAARAAADAAAFAAARAARAARAAFAAYAADAAAFAAARAARAARAAAFAAYAAADAARAAFAAYAAADAADAAFAAYAAADAADAAFAAAPLDLIKLATLAMEQ